MSYPIQLFVGLGNPGIKYERNRHNAGFLFLDALAADNHITSWQQKFHSEITDITASHQGKSSKIYLLKPQTYMNKSGLAVTEACKFYKIPPEAVTVFHDELDIPPLTLKVKRGGGHGGHNGLRDIDAHIGKNYRRIRIGIGHPGHKDAVTGYVLRDFSQSEQQELPHLWNDLIRALPLLVYGKDTELMNELHPKKK